MLCTRLPAGASAIALTPFFAPGHRAINPIHACGLFDCRCDPDTEHPCLAMSHNATAGACVVTTTPPARPPPMHRARRRTRSHLSPIYHHCCPRNLLHHGRRPCTIRSVIRIPGPPRHLACPHARGGGARGAAGYIIRYHGLAGGHRRPRDLRHASPALRHVRPPCAHASTVVVWSAPLAAAATPLL